MMADSMMSVDENASLDKLEITKNPFDSNLFDRENFPVLDSSVFVDSTQNDQKSPEEFRWSIDQIAKLKPAEMDLFPNQEYSITYEKKEDEERDQQQVDEYFKNVLLPSPWLENRNEILKRVTFSPHPPSTRYISHMEEGDFDNGSPVHLSMNNNKNVKFDRNDETMLSDACCQTVLTFPIDFNLESLIPKQFYSYIENDNEARELMVSSLRRKLFGQDITPVKSKPTESVSPVYSTSSPTKDSPVIRRNLSTDHSFDDESPPISPLKGRCGGETPCVFSSDDCDEFSPIKQASNMGTPQHLRADISLSPVIETADKTSTHDEVESDYSFLPDVSFDINDDTNDDCFHESSRAVRFNAPGISPIRSNPNNGNLQKDPVNLTTDSCMQSVKESTARNLHAIFDISSINQTNSNSQCSSNNTRDDDEGPLHISELSSDSEVTLPSSNMENTNEKSQNDIKNDQFKENDFKSPTEFNAISPTDLPTPLKSILKKRDNVTPFRTNLKNFVSAEDTKYNTECNSGRRNIPIDYASRERVTQNMSTRFLPRPILSEKQISVENKYNENESNISGVDPICAHARAVLNRARQSASNSIELDLDDKENFFFPNRRELKLNSTEVNSNDSLERFPNSNIRLDSGVGTMENITSQTSLVSNNTPTYSKANENATPSLPFERLTLNSVSPWASKLKFQKNGYINKSKFRCLITRSRSWPDRSCNQNIVPKSRVNPRLMPRQIALSRSPFTRSPNLSPMENLNSGYKALLQSPLK